jgi:hypothetical protein
MVNRGEFVVNIWLRDGTETALENGTGFWGLFCDGNKCCLPGTKNKQRHDKYGDPSLRSRMTTKTSNGNSNSNRKQQQQQQPQIPMG